MIPRLIFIPLVAWAAHSQSTAPYGLTYSFNGAGVAIHTESSASHSPLSTSGAVTTHGEAAYRIVLDRDDRLLFAYQLEIRGGPPNDIRVTIKPADQAGLRSLDWGWLKGNIVADVPTIAAVRAFPPLRLGDEVHVDIMYNPKTGEKLWDVIRVTPEAQPMPKPGKVFTGPQFSWEGVKVAIDGKVVADRIGTWMVGEAIRMRVPGHGEYYLVLHPPAGFPFQPSGWVDRNVMWLHGDGEEVQITGKSNLLMKSETGTVWVYHVPEARAKGKADTVDITCSGDADLLMRK
jgi:hypothetical protein